MTPKEALEHIEKQLPLGLQNVEACEILRSLIEHPTVAEVREEIEKKREGRKNQNHQFALGVVDACSELLNFIDRKGV